MPVVPENTPPRTARYPLRLALVRRLACTNALLFHGLVQAPALRRGLGLATSAATTAATTARTTRSTTTTTTMTTTTAATKTAATSKQGDDDSDDTGDDGGDNQTGQDT